MSGTDPGNKRDDIKCIYRYMSAVTTSDGWTEFAQEHDIIFDNAVVRSWGSEDSGPELVTNLNNANAIKIEDQ